MRSLDRTREEWLTTLIRDVRASSGVGYRDLATALRAAIVSGEVPVGTKLPPQREFARLLSIGRTSVVAAYNLLRGESLLVTRQGAGTWVARRPASEPRAGRP
jgi:DNA-binding GntR family transcriptional regulator